MVVVDIDYLLAISRLGGIRMTQSGLTMIRWVGKVGIAFLNTILIPVFAPLFMWDIITKNNIRLATRWKAYKLLWINHVFK